MRAFLQRLRERTIVQWAFAYCAGAWAVLEVMGLIAEQFGLPLGVARALWVLAAIGLLVTLTLAWYHGEAGAQRVSGPELVIIGALLSIAGGLLWIVGRSTDVGPRPAPTEVQAGTSGLPDESQYLASVAVLPLQNLGPSEDQYLGNGFADELITQLAQVRGLKVSSWTSVSALQGAHLTIPEIADTLGVAHVLEGTIRRSGNATRITIQLIEARTDSHLWAKSFDRVLTDLFEVQEDVARATLEALLDVVPELRPATSNARTEEGRAYQLYLEGRYAAHQRTRGGLARAIAAFQASIQLDPSFAPAYAGLGGAYGLWLRYGYPAEGGEYVMAGKALAAVDRSIALDPESGEAYAARGWIRTLAWGPLDEIGNDFERALELQPNSTDAHGWHGHFLQRAGLHEAALEEALKAIELDPVAPGRRVGYAIDALGMRQFDRALQEAERALSLEPDLATARFTMGLALLLAGRYHECLDLDLSPHRAVRAMCLYSAGRTDEAGTLVGSLVASADNEQLAGAEISAATLLRDLAAYFAWIGDAEQSSRFLKSAFAATPYGVDFRLWSSGVFERVKGQSTVAAAYATAQATAWERVVVEWRRTANGMPDSLF